MKQFFDTVNKSLLKVFLFFTIVCQFSMVFASDEIFADGGTSGGGGNVSSSPLINKDKLKQFIKMSIPYQKQIFTVNWYFDGERITPKKEGLSNVYTKLFHSKKTIYDVLDHPPKFTFQEYPCIDPKTGQPVHSSALIDQNEICFDINSLSQILTENTYIRKILALISHELSHFVLTNENEANIIQGIIEDELKIESRNEYIIQNSKSSSNIRAKGLVKEIENILLKFSEIKSVDLCLNLISLSTRLIDLKNETYQFLHSLGLSYFYSPSSEVEAWSMVLRASNLRSYCGTTSIADQIDPDYKISFFQNGESELELSLVAKLMYFPKLLHPYTGTIYSLGKDPTKVKTELELIKESLIEAFIKNENR